ncbi:MAG: response regulator transcription factor [Thermoleophilia bacterium]
MRTVLVVEDEPAIARLVGDYLDRAGFRPVLEGTAAGALARFAAETPDLVVLDLGLPDADGLDVARRMRRDAEVPIVVLTARGDETDRIVGLELGADDYVVKPFSPKELVARVRAVLRRTHGVAGDPELITAGDVVIDVPRHRVTVGEREVVLTASEFTLLCTLAGRPGRVFTRGQLLDVLHGVSFDSYERAIDAHIKNLRRKLEPGGGAHRRIGTVHGVGYRFDDAT